VAWGRTDEVLTPANLQRLRAMPEAFDDRAAVCEVPSAGTPHDQHHAHDHQHHRGAMEPRP